MKEARDWNRMIDILKKEVVPATGCTEPISLAFASAVAAEKLGIPVRKIEARVSANMMKNGMGVYVPGTGMPGLYIAAAVGAAGGDPTAGLQVLKNLSPAAVDKAKKLVADGQVTVDIADVPNILYSESKVYGDGHTVRVCIADNHTHVIRIERDDNVIFRIPESNNAGSDPETTFLNNLTLEDIYVFATQSPLADIAFIKEAATLNTALAEAGLTQDYGHRVGATMNKEIKTGFLSEALQNLVIMYTASASDARMGGAPLPAMTNSGSGNQGITATMPVVVTAKKMGASDEQLIRALTLSHLIAIYIHSFLPRLSALCAAGTAAIGAAAGMVWLLGGTLEQIKSVVSNMAGDHIGMVCDGAANSCTMKVATSCDAACRAVMLALHNICVTGNEGLVSHDADETIRNIGSLAEKGMQETDREILRIMLNKNKSGSR
ncbi:serine dehydratase subunit alpha family protein [Megasphaera cerevisiae]|jgi:L-cysteine desulfidase|uniref:L-cysteine desulfidase family protein n=1 Tax=Megasphaera cerevisiae TaxID=39029 RepID=UPI000943C72E|nr:L-serine ammonia-lyase, iron-sulfur-dependent, subunit alpha [Megasphaera cerevisiae]OKY54603.1 hypothetical protein BSR42_01965 [Megasphaera cerevisiae]